MERYILKEIVKASKGSVYEAANHFGMLEIRLRKA
jgi:hypothetical protein